MLIIQRCGKSCGEAGSLGVVAGLEALDLRWFSVSSCEDKTQVSTRGYCPVDEVENLGV